MSSTPSADSPASSRGKLPIYDEPSQEVILVKTELPLQPQVRWARAHVQALKQELNHKVELVLEHGLKVEKEFAGGFQGLIDKKETNSSSVLSVAIGTMTGSIIARNRSLPLRVLSPLALFSISSYHFLPVTSHNVKSYLFKLQDQHFPRSAAARDDAIRQSIEGLNRLKQMKNQLLHKTDEAFKDGRRVFEKYSGFQTTSDNTSKGQN